MFEVMMQNSYFLCLSSQHIIFPDIKKKKERLIYIKQLPRNSARLERTLTLKSE